MALFWRRVTLSSNLPAEEVQTRLAAAMVEWGRYFRGRSPQPLPWTDGRFFAVPPPGLWSPLVLEGVVQAGNGTTEVKAVIRPHGLAAASPFILSAVILALASAESDPALMLVPLALVWMLATVALWLSVAERAPAVEDALVAALRGPP